MAFKKGLKSFFEKIAGALALILKRPYNLNKGDIPSLSFLYYNVQYLKFRQSFRKHQKRGVFKGAT